MQPRLSPRLREYVVRWSRVAMAVALVGLSVSLIRADHKVAELERLEPYVRSQRHADSARIGRLEAQIRVLEGVMGLQTTTTQTTVLGRLAERRNNRPNSVPVTTGGSPQIPTPVPMPPKPCRVILPFNHACLLSVQIGPIRL